MAHRTARAAENPKRAREAAPHPGGPAHFFRSEQRPRWSLLARPLLLGQGDTADTIEVEDPAGDTATSSAPIAATAATRLDRACARRCLRAAGTEPLDQAHWARARVPSRLALTPMALSP